MTIEEVVKIFAPDDSGEGTVKSTEEGTFLISNKGNHFYISQHRVLFEKEDEAQRQKNDEIINLLNLYAQDNPKNSAQDLDFINRNDAIQLVEDLLKKVGVNLKPILRAYVSLPAQTIMDYQQDLLKRDHIMTLLVRRLYWMILELKTMHVFCRLIFHTRGCLFIMVLLRYPM